MSFRRIAKITIICALIMFFTPFMMVSCSEAGAEETYTGMELIICSTEGDSLISSGDVDEDEFSPNFFLIGALGCGIAALVLLFVKKEKDGLVPALLSAASAFLLILFRATFVSFYNLEEYKDYLEIKTKWGYVLCLLLMIGSAALCVLPQHNRTPLQIPEDIDT